MFKFGRSVPVMKIVIAGGTGQVGRLLQRAWAADGHELVVLARHAGPVSAGVRLVGWDGRTV